MVVNKLLTFVVLLLLHSAVMATPTIQNWQTSNGARVLFVQAPELPMLDARVVFDAGSARDEGLPGLAMITNALLTEGAGKLNADQIAERIDDVGAELSASSLRDMAIVSLRTLTEKHALDTSVSIMADVIARPSFVRSAIDRNLQAMKISLRQDEQSPSSVASKAFYRALYIEHPYAQPSGGTRDSLNSINRKDIEKFHQQYYVAKNAVLVMVGDVDRNQAENLAEQLLGKLPAGERATQLPAVEMIKAQRNEIDFSST